MDKNICKSIAISPDITKKPTSMKKCSRPLDIKEMQIKTTMTNHIVCHCFVTKIIMITKIMMIMIDNDDENKVLVRMERNWLIHY